MAVAASAAMRAVVIPITQLRAVWGATHPHLLSRIETQRRCSLMRVPLSFWSFKACAYACPILASSCASRVSLQMSISVPDVALLQSKLGENLGTILGGAGASAGGSALPSRHSTL